MISKKIGIVESIVDQNGELDDIRVKNKWRATKGL